MSNNIKKNQIASIVGATATGKTAFALQLAKLLLSDKHYQKIHLLSADSRQVYCDLENLTGADVPSDFTKHKTEQFDYSFFQNEDENIFLHGVSIIKPTEEWSVAHFQQLFANIKNNLVENDFLLVVGGTGFYQQQVLETAENIYIPQNHSLRENLEKLSVTELQNELSELDKIKLQSMNNSDLNNPRRLIRAIEIIHFTTKHPNFLTKQSTNILPIFYLQINKETREQKIRQRVTERFELAKAEVDEQLKLGQSNTLAASSTGFAELSKFIQGEIDQTTCLELWQTAEIQYAKRQDTWWKKRPNLISIDPNDINIKINQAKILQACYI